MGEEDMIGSTWVYDVGTNKEMEEIWRLSDNSEMSNESYSGEQLFDTSSYYRLIIPIMVVFCVISAITNIAIVFSVHWVRRSLSPTLCYSISLAMADAYASLVIGIGLVVNSLLPVGYMVDMGDYSMCSAIILEAFRLSGMIASVLHLLALAVNHYIGIIRPLHYASTMTRRNAMISIVFMWLVPLVFFFTYFGSVPGGGFQSEYCHSYHFITRLTFRTVQASLFFVPLLLMVFAYSHIFVIIRKHQRGILQYQNATQLNKNVKAVITTLLILGTYIFGWIPAVIFSLLTCTDGPYSYEYLPPSFVIQMSVALNTLIILKSLIDPIVYAARMKEIRSALQRMRRIVLCCRPCVKGGGGGGANGTGRRFLRTNGRDDQFSSFRTTRTETMGTSVRLQSVKKDADGSVLIYQTKGTQDQTQQQQTTCLNSELVGVKHNGL